LEVLREPLESRQIMISRANAQACYPANFQLVAAMNPCPCGFLGSDRCRCTPDQVRRYRDKISGPLLDRIDLQVNVPHLPGNKLIQQRTEGETSETVYKRVLSARQKQTKRAGKLNALMSNQEAIKHCPLDDKQKSLLNNAIKQLGLTARGFHRVIKIARTIADLDVTNQNDKSHAETPNINHLTEALSYRVTR